MKNAIVVALIAAGVLYAEIARPMRRETREQTLARCTLALADRELTLNPNTTFFVTPPPGKAPVLSPAPVVKKKKKRNSGASLVPPNLANMVTWIVSSDAATWRQIGLAFLSGLQEVVHARSEDKFSVEVVLSLPTRSARALWELTTDEILASRVYPLVLVGPDRKLAWNLTFRCPSLGLSLHLDNRLTATLATIERKPAKLKDEGTTDLAWWTLQRELVSDPLSLGTSRKISEMNWTLDKFRLTLGKFLELWGVEGREKNTLVFSVTDYLRDRMKMVALGAVAAAATSNDEIEGLLGPLRRSLIGLDVGERRPLVKLDEVEALARETASRLKVEHLLPLFEDSLARLRSERLPATIPPGEIEIPFSIFGLGGSAGEHRDIPLLDARLRFLTRWRYQPVVHIDRVEIGAPTLISTSVHIDPSHLLPMPHALSQYQMESLADLWLHAFEAE